ncbi:MAG: hypothetical protein A3G60_03330 [Candidatus Ryanbacteria bacterium RIFCSPLOWO2_12_FULL_47_9c]|uniref:Glycosyltransferase subfamily 4-like N-terminal domain-containing protein n=2 Tax=Candidatus Ryaniibacteriota TaxID=1817914 RepID=A0A1G2H6U4_9BACT|nr:MAG: hypothetical protein UX74_C0001G0035 [Parcubacteria group bacterium GW2011_GWA2_47_10b]KKU86429.1 MAG: hypothetical protein UY14_C0001G0008 [Parcubacteria group bacterium GW2011_GWA1_47_9]OGZ47890.1 MAG: hypothetical protein A3C83_03135 [Candidatus Ryanbacteria bacterium RIFCSPHIGHO2_02_FULL_47_25]OGZ56366.1 MAG: hypothetical protein A3J04_03605 [Candidatus Ryanbacteria bacterium RIFCSPLOWO2_02_FULL_47_14]OGZ58059.1 MAG: hypothetical protein A3G60_03330 [Candidatus Ryanbacteria bacteriu
MKILFALNRFKYLTGSELYIYELTRELVHRGHSATIISRIGGEITDRARKNGVNVEDSWKYLIKVRLGLKLPDFDILHLSEYLPTKRVLKTISTIPAVVTVHSEVLPKETPYVNSRIKKYICIRPSIQDMLINKYGIPRHMTEIIYNGIDFSRFNKISNSSSDSEKRKLVVFVGTIDRLRRRSIKHLINKSKKENFDLNIIGMKKRLYLGFSLPKNVRYFNAGWDVESHLKKASETAGVLLGRSTIEGWACGKPGWIYDVDATGNIKSVTLHKPPENMAQFNIHYMTDKILDVYKEAIL